LQLSDVCDKKLVVDMSDSLTTSLPDVSEPTSPSFARISRHSAVDAVRDQLTAMIESGELMVDDQLPSEAELGQSFGVSRPVIREALGSLQTLGLTESQPGRGTFVTSRVVKVGLSFGQYSATDLNEIRRYVEVPTAGRAAQLRTIEDLDELSRMLDEHEHATSAAESVRIDGQFHITIARATGNLLVVRLIEDLRETMQEQSLALREVPNRHESAAREHRAILEAIRRQNVDEAATAMAGHLEGVEVALGQLARQRTHKA
jgi:GntR family transcriptional repressor for pyruvate dehydrogenase complex